MHSILDNLGGCIRQDCCRHWLLFFKPDVSLAPDVSQDEVVLSRAPVQHLPRVQQVRDQQLHIS